MSTVTSARGTAPSLPEDAARFLAQFSGRHTFQSFDDRPEKSRSLSRILHDPIGLADLNRQGAGIFLMVNEGDSNGRKTESVTRIRAYCADFDGASLPQGWPLEPSMVVETSPGKFHTYWILQGGEVAPLDNDAWNRQQDAIARAVGSQPDDCKGLNRVMRIPGFLHQKGEPFTSRIVSSTVEQFSLTQIQTAFPLPALLPRPPAPERSHGDHSSTQAQKRRTYALSTLHHLADKLSSTPEGERNNKLNAVSFRAGRLIGGGHLERGEVEAELTTAALQSGLAEHEIGSTLHSGLREGIADPDSLEQVGNSTPGKHKKIRSSEDCMASGLPEIVVNERHLREIANDAQAALLTANEPPSLFLHGGNLTQLVSNESGVRLRTLDAVGLKGKLDRVADFKTLTERTEKGEDGKKEVVTDSKPARPPADLAPDLLARVEHLGLPVLRTLARSPIYDPGGALVSAEGYHAQSGIYLALLGLSIPPVPTVSEALALLRELLTDFPFSPHEAGFAHTLAALLLPFVRPMIDGPTPLHLIEAPTRGSGKGLLSEVIAHVTVGGPAGVMVQPKDDGEFEKRVTSILLEGAPVVLLDNVHTLKGEALAAALTTPMWRGRRLGKSEMLTLPNGALWLATGNNVTLDDDMPRRIIPIRLDPGVERPEERSAFRHPHLLAWIKVNRPALVAACLSLVEAWKAAGKPKGKARLGSFESWTATIGGILEVAGVPGFLTAREGLYETANAEPQEWAALLAALHKQHGEEQFGARDVLAAMKALDLCSDQWEGKPHTSALKRVGRAVAARRDRMFGGHRIRLAGKTATGNAGYKIERATPDLIETPETPKTLDKVRKASSNTAIHRDVSSAKPAGVSPVFVENTPVTSEKHLTRESGPDGAEGISGVFGVSTQPQLFSGDVVEL
jgi:RepB DNA-primase from phage plasmid